MGNKQSKTILYILPSKGWNTKERFAFKDIAQAKKHGYNILLCTIEGSYSASIAGKMGIEIIPYKQHFINRFFRFHRHLSLKSIFDKMHIDILHCYDLRLLCSIGLQLKRKNTTALVITQDRSIDKPLRNFWYRPLISRIDSLILINKNLLQDALGNLGLPPKKIKYFGLGIKYEEAADPEQIAINFGLYKKYFLVGTYVSPGLSNHLDLIPVLAALKVLNDKLPGGRKSKLVLISPVEFKSMSILPNLMKNIQDQELQEDVLFVTTQDIVGVISRLDLWVSYTAAELVEDFAISALVHEVPAILVRNFCSKELIEEYEGVGETYKISDSRELRGKWERVILGQGIFREKTRLYKYFIEREHSHHSYKNMLVSLYSKSVQRRARLFKRK